MRGLSAPGLLLLLSALALSHALGPRSARAWTAATVRSASAEVEVLPDGRAHVSMDVRVRVDGGWLEGLEIEGLDEDAALDPERPLTFRDANGVALPVEVSAREGGRVSLRFARRLAPRRGEYDVALAWTTALARTRALDEGALEARWVFPAWHYGLDAVEIRWVVPAGSAPQPEDELTAPIEIESSAREDGRAVITYRRAHLPRTSEWETVVRIPRGAWPHATHAEAAQAASPSGPPSTAGAPIERPARASAPAHEDRACWLGLTLTLVFAALLKRADLDTRARRTRRLGRALLGTPRWLHTLAGLAVAGLGVGTYALDWTPLASLVGAALLVAMSWQHGTQDAPRPRLLSLSAVSSREIALARRDRVRDWLAPSAWVDPGHLGGLTALVVTAGALGSDSVARVLAALCVAVVASGSRARLGPPPSRAVRVLSYAMEQLRLDHAAPFVSVRLLGRGAHDPFDVRLHVSLSEGSPRVLDDLRVELVAEGPEGGALGLRLAAREDTPADVALRAWAASEGRAVHDVARRRAVLVPCAARDAGPTLERTVRGVLALAPYEDTTWGEPQATLQAAE